VIGSFSDFYSIDTNILVVNAYGVILLECLSKKSPFAAKNDVWHSSKGCGIHNNIKYTIKHMVGYEH
jgi:hypothetical protein